MVFAKPLRGRVRSGEITVSIRIWTRPHVKAEGRYAMFPGWIVVESIEEIGVEDITPEMAAASGFESVPALLGIAKHGRGKRVFLVRFRYED